MFKTTCMVCHRKQFRYGQFIQQRGERVYIMVCPSCAGSPKAIAKLMEIDRCTLNGTGANDA